jgi:hypothetical protein
MHHWQLAPPVTSHSVCLPVPRSSWAPVVGKPSGASHPIRGITHAVSLPPPTCPGVHERGPQPAAQHQEPHRAPREHALDPAATQGGGGAATVQRRAADGARLCGLGLEFGTIRQPCCSVSRNCAGCGVLAARGQGSGPQSSGFGQASRTPPLESTAHQHHAPSPLTAPGPPLYRCTSSRAAWRLPCVT